jgi:hypothetical protein
METPKKNEDNEATNSTSHLKKRLTFFTSLRNTQTIDLKEDDEKE